MREVLSDLMIFGPYSDWCLKSLKTQPIIIDILASIPSKLGMTKGNLQIPKSWYVLSMFRILKFLDCGDVVNRDIQNFFKSFAN